jgi:hypothetical protein
LENLKRYNSINLENINNEPEINNIINDLYIAKSAKPMHKYNKSDINFMSEIKLITDNLSNSNINNNEIIASLIHFINLLNYFDLPKQLIEYFFKNYSIVNLMDILNSPNMNSDLLLVFSNMINAICLNNPNYIDEFITYQYIFNLINLIFAYNDIEIKSEIIYFIFQILIRSQNSLKVKNKKIILIKFL